MLTEIFLALFFQIKTVTTITTQYETTKQVQESTLESLGETNNSRSRNTTSNISTVSLVESPKGWKGYVSSYSATWGGCLGCTKLYDQNGQLWYRMANGERLDDARFTIAFFDLGLIPLNSRVSVTNLTNCKSTGAVVTDTGGFMECCDRIADLSIATAQAIEAKTDLDLIEIKTLEVEK